MDKLQLTKEQAIILTGFTGYTATTKFRDFREDVEKRLGRPVFTHEFAIDGMEEKIRELYREDFEAICP